MKFFIGICFATSVLFSNMKIYVSKNSTIDSISLRELKNLYLKKTKLLNNQKVIVYDNQEEYKNFCINILNKTDGHIHAYWMRQIFSGKKIPPDKIKYSEITFILKKNPFAISYSKRDLDAKVIYEFK